MTFNLEDVFVTEGVPEYTFVRPPNYVDILVDVRKTGKPVIIEGQSGTGKTTTIKRILQEIQISDSVYLTARKPDDLREIERISDGGVGGFYIIDDFHRLNQDIREKIANIAKLAAEQDRIDLPKLVIIGINQVGSDLIQLVHDIAKRTGIHKIQPGTEAVILSLVNSGCAKLNILLDNVANIFHECRGDYWLTQQLCQSICAMAGVTKSQDNVVEIKVDIDAVRARVVDRLHAAYYPAVKEFCRGRRFRPSNDPYFKLLRTIGQQESSIADLNELSNAIPDVRGSINNIKERRLAVLLESKPRCRDYFYYNVDSKNFAIEDPALFYFLKHLDWDRLRADCGFRDVPRGREWDIAISFAGENRDLARFITEQLEILDVHVFLDEYYEANYLGRAWSEQFKKIFTTESDLVVCLLDANHERKIWPTFERDCFRPRVAEGSVIPIILDDTIFVGISQDIVAIHFRWSPDDPNWQRNATEQIVMRLIDRL